MQHLAWTTNQEILTVDLFCYTLYPYPHCPSQLYLRLRPLLTDTVLVQKSKGSKPPPLFLATFCLSFRPSFLMLLTPIIPPDGPLQLLFKSHTPISPYSVSHSRPFAPMSSRTQTRQRSTQARNRIKDIISDFGPKASSVYSQGPNPKRESLQLLKSLRASKAASGGIVQKIESNRHINAHSVKHRPKSSHLPAHPHLDIGRNMEGGRKNCPDFRITPIPSLSYYKTPTVSPSTPLHPESPSTPTPWYPGYLLPVFPSPLKRSPSRRKPPMHQASPNIHTRLEIHHRLILRHILPAGNTQYTHAALIP